MSTTQWNSYLLPITEGYAVFIVEETGLASASTSPCVMSFHSGLIPHIDLTPEARTPLIAKIQLWMGMLTVNLSLEIHQV